MLKHIVKMTKIEFNYELLLNIFITNFKLWMFGIHFEKDFGIVCSNVILILNYSIAISNTLANLLSLWVITNIQASNPELESNRSLNVMILSKNHSI